MLKGSANWPIYVFYLFSNCLIRKCFFLLQGCGYYKKKSLKIHQKWHHMCLTLKTDYLNSDEVSITTKMYLDGRLVTGGK